MRRCLALVLAALAGCGGPAGEEALRAPSGAVTVAVLPEGEGGVERSRRIECPRSALCARLARASFAPTPATVACTELYGGPGTASVRGNLGARRIGARFSLVNGCEIARWERFAWLLGPPPG